MRVDEVRVRYCIVLRTGIVYLVIACCLFRRLCGESSVKASHEKSEKNNGRFLPCCCGSVASLIMSCVVIDVVNACMWRFMGAAVVVVRAKDPKIRG